MGNGDEPAFATPDSGTEFSTTWQGQKGLTKREYFAGLALQGLISGLSEERKTVSGFIPVAEYQTITQHSVQIADELLKQLET